VATVVGSVVVVCVVPVLVLVLVLVLTALSGGCVVGVVPDAGGSLVAALSATALGNVGSLSVDGAVVLVALGSVAA
jgi:hypothetical protein